MLDADELKDSRTTGTPIAITATAAAVVGLASTYLLQGLVGDDHGFDLPGFLLGTAVTLVLAAVLFGKVVPGALHEHGETNRPATAALITSIFAFLGLAVFWLGVPLIVAGAGIALGRGGRERSRRSGRRGFANAAIGISAFVVVATVAVLVNDVLGLFGLGIQPPQ